MKVNSISNYSCQNGHNKSNFGHAYVALSAKNLGEEIAKNVQRFNDTEFKSMYKKSVISADKVLDAVTSKYFPSINSSIRMGHVTEVDDLQKKADLFILAGGKGSRFAQMSDAVAQLRGKGEKLNKISVPFEVGNGYEPLKMLDVPLATTKFFANSDGFKPIIAKEAKGSFTDVITHFSHNEPKDVLVCCGDNVFDAKAEDLLSFFVKTMNNDKKQMGMIGVARTPEVVADTFGVMGVQPTSQKGIFALTGFVEKPPIEEARKLVTPDGNNIANTGMFLMKKDAIGTLVDMLKFEEKYKGKSTLIAKNDKEIYDFATAQKLVQKMVGPEACDVKVVDTWEDVGSPKAYLSWMNSMKDGKFLGNFSPSYQHAIKSALKGDALAQPRVGENFIKFTPNAKQSVEVDGIKVFA